MIQSVLLQWRRSPPLTLSLYQGNSECTFTQTPVAHTPMSCHAIALMADKEHLVLAVVLLGVTQDTVTQAADVPEGGMALVSQFLQSQHGTVPAVCEGSLQQLEDLSTVDTGNVVTITTKLKLQL